jgi:drug/metabolite transporter (DMT)-like permease
MAVLAALWGASYMFIKFAIEDLSDLALVFFRIALGALILAPVALRSGALPAVRRHLGWLTLIAVVQIMVPFLLITIGEHHVSSSLTGILVASAPIFTVLIAMVAVKDESVHGWSLAGIFVGMAGVALLFGLDLGGDSQALLGGLAILLASVGYAIGALIARRKLSGVPPIGVAGSIMGISTVLLLPTLPWSIAASSTPDLGTVASMVALGAGGTGIAFLIFYTLNAEIGPARASIVAYIAPAFSIGYGVAFLDESFTASTAAGMLLILAGSWTGAQGRPPWRRAPAREVSRSGPSRSSVPAPVRAR